MSVISFPLKFAVSQVVGLNENSFGSKCQCFGFGRQTECSPDSVALKQRLQNRGFTVW